MNVLAITLPWWNRYIQYENMLVWTMEIQFWFSANYIRLFCDTWRFLKCDSKVQELGRFKPKQNWCKQYARLLPNAWTCKLRGHLCTKDAQLSSSNVRRGLRLYSAHLRGIHCEDVSRAWRILRATWCHPLIEQTYSLKVQDSRTTRWSCHCGQ